MNNGKNIFVFGSNLSGVHGCGAAKEARLHWGAQIGVGSGPMGQAYALPTKDEQIDTLPLSEIEQHIRIFLEYAKNHPDKKFLVTAVGCGLAGYKPEDIALFFFEAPSNCFLPDEFLDCYA